MAGTELITSAFVCSISLRASPGSNASSSTWVPHVQTGPSTALTQPPTWNSGIGLSQTPPPN